MSYPDNVTYHPAFIKFRDETMRMVTLAQISEDNVAMIDRREPRRATIRVDDTDTIVIIYEEQP